MKNNRLQNKISESIVTLPLCAVLCFVVWLWNAMHSAEGLCLSTCIVPIIAAITTLIIMETNNRNALLRIRSRMVSAVWILCVAMMNFAHHFMDGWIAALSLAASMYLLLGMYQEHEPVVPALHTAFLLGVCIISIPWTLVMIPLYWWYMLVFLRCITWRTFWASIIGLILPLWFTFGWCLFKGDYSFLISRMNEITHPESLNPDAYRPLLNWHDGNTLALALIVLLLLIGAIHFLRTYYQDKIRTRMLLYIYVMQATCCILIVALQPNLIRRMMLPLTVCSSPLIAHYLALTGKRLTNIVFIISALLAGAVITLNMGLWRL